MPRKQVQQHSSSQQQQCLQYLAGRASRLERRLLEMEQQAASREAYVADLVRQMEAMQQQLQESNRRLEDRQKQHLHAVREFEWKLGDERRKTMLAENRMRQAQRGVIRNFAGRM